MKISFDCCANTFSNLDVDNDVVSIDSQMNSMDGDDNDVEDDERLYIVVLGIKYFISIS